MFQLDHASVRPDAYSIGLQTLHCSQSVVVNSAYLYKRVNMHKIHI